MRINERTVFAFGLTALIAGLALFLAGRSQIADMPFYFWAAVVVLGAIGASSIQIGRDLRPKNPQFGLILGFGIALLGFALFFLLVGLFGSLAEAEERVFTTIMGGLLIADGFALTILGFGKRR